MTRIAFTGTRSGMKPEQRSTFTSLMAAMFTTQFENEWHDGDCIGADDEAHQIVARMKQDREGHALGVITMVGHPGDTPQYYASNVFDETREPKGNIDRNHDMVDEAEILVACPGEMENVPRGSGTWATIRYALKQLRHRTNLWIFIVYPDGTLDLKGPEPIGGTT